MLKIICWICELVSITILFYLLSTMGLNMEGWKVYMCGIAITVISCSSYIEGRDRGHTDVVTDLVQHPITYMGLCKFIFNERTKNNGK